MSLSLSLSERSNMSTTTLQFSEDAEIKSQLTDKVTSIELPWAAKNTQITRGESFTKSRALITQNRQGFAVQPGGLKHWSPPGLPPVPDIALSRSWHTQAHTEIVARIGLWIV